MPAASAAGASGSACPARRPRPAPGRSRAPREPERPRARRPPRRRRGFPRARRRRPGPRRPAQRRSRRRPPAARPPAVPPSALRPSAVRPPGRQPPGRRRPARPPRRPPVSGPARARPPSRRCAAPPRGDRRLGLRGLGFLSRSLLRRLGALGLRHGRATVRRLSHRRVLRLAGLRGHRRLHSALRSDSDARLLSGLRRLAGRGVPCLRGATRRRVPGRSRPRHDRRDLLAVRRRRPLALGGDRGADRLGGDPGDGRLGRVRRSRDRSRAARALGDPGRGLRCRRLACARDVEVLGAEGRRARLAGRQVGGAAVGEGADRARGQVGQRRAEVQRTARRGR